MYIFISHSSKNSAIARNICSELEKNGFECFFSTRDIKAGSVYAEELIDGIDRSDILLLLLSSASNTSPHVLREVERACSKNIPIVVYKLENVTLSKAMEYFLMTHQWVDKNTGNDAAALIPILKDIENRKNNNAAATDTPQPVPNINTTVDTARDKKIRLSRSVIICAAVLFIALVTLIVILLAGRKSDIHDKQAEVTETPGEIKTVQPDITDVPAEITAGAADISETPDRISDAPADSGTVAHGISDAPADSGTVADGISDAPADIAVITATPDDATGNITATPDDTTGNITTTPDNTAGNITATPDDTAGNITVTPDDTTGKITVTPDDTTGNITATPDDITTVPADITDAPAVTEAPVNSGIAAESEPGEIITFGKYNNDPIDWIVLHKNADGSSILISKDILCLKAFDAPESGEFGSCYDEALIGDTPMEKMYWTSSKAALAPEILIQAYGNNDWSVSNLRTWLNAGTQVVTYPDSAPTNAAAVTHGTGYATEFGFLNSINFTKDEQNALIPYSYEYTNSITGKVTECTDKVFILSQEELSWFSDYALSPLAAPTEKALETDYEHAYDGSYTNGFHYWWLRDGSPECVCMTTLAAPSLDPPVTEWLSSYYGVGGVRPCICVK